MGTELQRATRNGKQIFCPACKGGLMTLISDGVEVDECIQCTGVWVDTMEEKVFLQIYPDVFTIDELRQLRKFYKPFDKLQPVQYRKCPVCSDIMHRRNWGGSSGVIVDRCAQHGVWFDPEEPEKIREYIKLGGIELEKLGYVDDSVRTVNAKLDREVKHIHNRITHNKGHLARLWAGVTGIHPY